MIFYNIWRTISLANLNQGVCKEPGMTLVANFYLDDDGFFGVLCKRYQKSRHVHLIKHSILMSRRYVYSTVQCTLPDWKIRGVVVTLTQKGSLSN